MIKKLIKKLLPKSLLVMYHKLWAMLGNIVYGFPSHKLTVIGVTGTKGKSTTSNMLWYIFTEAGCKTGMTTTANFRIGEKEWINDTKMTMRGRMQLQKLLRQMVDAGCEYAIIETSSEGMAQYRHWGIVYDAAVITNLTPEHIESHGSFEKYKKIKGELFRALKGKGISVTNADDEHAPYYQAIPADKHITFGIDHASDIRAKGIEEKGEQGTYAIVNEQPLHVPLVGRFNLSNALAAIAVARGFEIPWDACVKGIAKCSYVPGRMEVFHSQKGFAVYVDYAHTAESLEAVYRTLKKDSGRLIAVLGSCGGGRDKAKRPILGKLAGTYSDVVIVTNEDPYDEDPQTIIDMVWDGINNEKIEKYQIIDRKKAITKALDLAQKGDTVVITGKGSEQCIVTAEGKIPWDDRQVVQEIIARP